MKNPFKAGDKVELAPQAKLSPQAIRAARDVTPGKGYYVALVGLDNPRNNANVGDVMFVDDVAETIVLQYRSLRYCKE